MHKSVSLKDLFVQEEDALKQQHEAQLVREKMAQQGIGLMGGRRHSPWIEEWGTTSIAERINPNEREAYQLPLAVIVDMWRVRYGNEWVDTTQAYDGNFYADACRRLNTNNLFEKYEGWARLKDEVA